MPPQDAPFGSHRVVTRTLLRPEHPTDGYAVGTPVGRADGVFVGAVVGSVVGVPVGSRVGDDEGSCVGD